MSIKVILTNSIKGVGEPGDVLTVKDGYARNYLLPKGLAKPATSSNLAAVEEEKKKIIRKKDKEKAVFQQLADKIAGVSCTVSVRAGEDDKLFGAVTTEAIAKACETEGVTVDKRSIQIDQPIKKLGVYQIPIKLHPEVVATLKLWIVKE